MFRFSTLWNCFGERLSSNGLLRYGFELFKKKEFSLKPIEDFNQLVTKEIKEMITEITRKQLLTWRLGV